MNLNLLGLKVHLNRVHLNITAQTGPGNLVGNLLCAVAHLLDGTPLSAGRLRLAGFPSPRLCTYTLSATIAAARRGGM